MNARAGTAVDQEHPTVSLLRASAKRAPRLAPDAEERARELMTMTAHDLRTPLAAIKMRAHRIAQRWRAGEEPTSAEWAAVVSGMTRAADEAFGLIDDLLGMERLQQRQRTPVRRGATDVESVVEEAIAHQSDALAEARCKVTVHRRKGLDHARGSWDHGYLLRILSNLLRNTAKHAPGAPVYITLGRRGDRLAIVFADRGPGLPESGGCAVHDQRDDVGAESSSHGLGLWIVRRAVERLNGRLRVRNTPARGVTFDMELPGLQT